MSPNDWPPEATTGICGADGCRNEIVLDEAGSFPEGMSDGRFGPATVALLVCRTCYEAHHREITEVPE